MKIALDHDGTITLDPELWQKFVDLFKSAGHDVTIVTFRPEDCPVEYDLGCPVIYTSAHPKRIFTEAMGIEIDVWIDDLPELIVQESDWSLSDRERWREEYWASKSA